MPTFHVSGNCGPGLGARHGTREGLLLEEGQGDADDRARGRGPHPLVDGQRRVLQPKGIGEAAEGGLLQSVHRRDGEAPQQDPQEQRDDAAVDLAGGGDPPVGAEDEDASAARVREIPRQPG